MKRPSRRHATLLLAGSALFTACSHSSPTEAEPITPQGPLASGNDVRLTTNLGSDYWPSWTEDGSGILYRFAQPGHGDDDRCVGLIPAAGGTQLWHLCDTRVGDADSSSSFGGVALGADGRLLYQELTARKNKVNPDHLTLWLGDSAAPFVRTGLIDFPVFVGGTLVTVLRDIRWTAHDQFIALAQDLQYPPNCPPPIKSCPLVDSLFIGLMVVRGTVTTSGATLATVSGTSQAIEYSLAASGATIVFVRSTLNVEQVPGTGGTPTIVTTFPVTGNRSILGLTCSGGACIVLTSETLPAVPPNTIPFPTWSLWKVTLADGTQTFLRSSTVPLLTPRVSPLTGDVVVQSGLKSAGDLYLYKGLLP